MSCTYVHYIYHYKNLLIFLPNQQVTDEMEKNGHKYNVALQTTREKMTMTTTQRTPNNLQNKRLTDIK